VWDACRGPLSENGLAVIQQTESDDSGVFVITTLAHSSGQWMRSRLRLHPKDDTPQGMGSAITYGRRYALASMVGVAQVDDDGNAASGRPTGVTTVDPRGDMAGKADPKKVAEYAKRFRAAMDADKEEAQIAADVYVIHEEVMDKAELYIDIGNALPAKYKNAIRDYVAIHKQMKKAS
jgi:hypothetical protein